MYRSAKKIFTYKDFNNHDVMKEFIYFKKIIPDRVIKNKNAYEITYLPPECIINGFCVTTVNNLVQKVHVFGIHPNVDLTTKEFCLPNHKLNTEYNDIYYDLLRMNFRTFYLDSAHFIPNKLEYKKIKSIYLQFNRWGVNNAKRKRKIWFIRRLHIKNC